MCSNSTMRRCMFNKYLQRGWRTYQCGMPNHLVFVHHALHVAKDLVLRRLGFLRFAVCLPPRDALHWRPPFFGIMDGMYF